MARYHPNKQVPREWHLPQLVTTQAHLVHSQKKSQLASQSTAIPQLSPLHESEKFPTSATVNYPQSFTDILRVFATSQSEGSPILYVRQLLAEISHMGFTLIEPAAERPNQRNI